LGDWSAFISFPQLVLGHLFGEPLLFCLEPLDEHHDHLGGDFADVEGDFLADEGLLLTAPSLEEPLHQVPTTSGGDRAFVGQADEVGVHAVRNA
jgi:hypothetical protein